jgi:hypothetical protein
MIACPLFPFFNVSIGSEFCYMLLLKHLLGIPGNKPSKYAQSEILRLQQADKTAALKIQELGIITTVIAGAAVSLRCKSIQEDHRVAGALSHQ